MDQAIQIQIRDPVNIIECDKMGVINRLILLSKAQIFVYVRSILNVKVEKLSNFKDIKHIKY